MTIGSISKDYTASIRLMWKPYDNPVIQGSPFYRHEGQFVRKSWVGGDNTQPPKDEIVSYNPPAVLTLANWRAEAREPGTGSGLAGVLNAYKQRLNSVRLTKKERSKLFKQIKEVKFHLMQERKRKRLTMFEPHAYNMYSHRCIPGTPETFYHVNGTEVYGATYMAVFSENWPFPPAVWGISDDYKFIEKAYNRIAGNSFNMPVFLAEGNQSLDLITDTCKRLAKAFQLVRRGNPLQALSELAPSRTVVRQIQRKFANDPALKPGPGYRAGLSWLELQLGWQPLLVDIHNAAQIVAHRVNVPFVQRHRVRHSKSLTMAEINGYCVNATFANASSFVSKQVIFTFREPPSVVQLTGFDNPMLAVHELVPLSFVADWFLPLGNYLEARGRAPALLGDNITTVVHKRSMSSPVLKNGWDGTDSGFLREEVYLDRNLNVAIDVPKPEVIPLSEAISWKRATTALALVTVLGQNFARDFKVRSDVFRDRSLDFAQPSIGSSI